MKAPPLAAEAADPFCVVIGQRTVRRRKDLDPVFPSEEFYRSAWGEASKQKRFAELPPAQGESLAIGC